MNENGNNSPWKEIYARMGTGCPKNDTEKHILEMLGAGKDLSDCLLYWKSEGMDEESFLEFMRRADEWETEEIRRLNQKQRL